MKNSLSVKFKFAAYAFIGYGFFEQVFIDDVSIDTKHPSRSVAQFSALKIRSNHRSMTV